MRKTHLDFILLPLIYLLVFTATVHSQENVAKTIHDEASMLYGSNDFIERGYVYIPDHPKANGHPYFMNADWNSANIKFLGDVITGMKIKYNIVDQLVILQKSQDGASVKIPLLLNSSQIDQFEIEGHLFTNLNRNDTNIRLQGFGEIIYAGNIKLIRKYSKNFINQYNKTNPEGLYSKLITSYYLQKENKVLKIYNKRSLINSFPEINKKLKKKLREMKFRFRKASYNEWIEIMSWCDNES